MSPHAGVDLQTEFGDRFHYWSGASGTRYIHSIYAIDDCPPLPGAVFVEVEVLACGTRKPVRCGRFSPLWDMPTLPTARAHEMHVHLLAGSDADADQVLSDIRAGLGLGRPAAARSDRFADQPSATPSAPHRGFNESADLPLFEPLAA